LLWFDDDPGRSIEDKVLRAAAHYERKYGQPPNLCFVHPSAFEGNEKTGKAGGVEIRSGRSVLKHHLWIGVADSGKSRSQRSLAAQVEAAQQPMTAERARQLMLTFEQEGVR
jgi:hypothetical protein